MESTGSSGRTYDLDDLIEVLTVSDNKAQYTVRDFELKELSEGVVLATYQLDAISGPETIKKQTLRSSIWKRNNSGWRMIFHQGTPTGTNVLPESDLLSTVDRMESRLEARVKQSDPQLFGFYISTDAILLLVIFQT